MAWGARSGLKQKPTRGIKYAKTGLNGLGSPFGIETIQPARLSHLPIWSAKWPGEPVRD